MQPAVPLALASALSGAIIGLLGLWLTRSDAAPARLLVATSIVIALVHSGVFVRLSGQPEQTVLFVIIMLLAAFVSLDVRVTVGLEVVALVVWHVVARDMAPEAHTHWQINVVFVAGMATALTVSQVRLVRTLDAESSALAEARDTAVVAIRQRDELMAGVSHSLRTPLNGILGVLELLEREPDPAQWPEHLEQGRACTHRLRGLVEDILDYAAGAADRIVERVELASLFAGLADDHAATGEEQDRRLALRDRGAPEALRTDPARLGRIVRPVVQAARAVGKTPGATVAVDLTATPDGEGLRVEVSVGTALPETEALGLDQVVRIGATHTPALVAFESARRQTELIEGQLTGRVDREGCLVIRADFASLDAEGAPERAMGDRPVGPSPPVSALIVEDNAMNRKVVSGLLESLGCKVEAARDGREAVVKFRSEAYDLVLMDYHMPVLDGPGAAAEIRQLEKATGTRVPIIALTANATERGRKDCIEAGMDEYLTKPTSRQVLARAIATWVPRFAAG